MAHLAAAADRLDDWMPIPVARNLMVIAEHVLLQH